MSEDTLLPGPASVVVQPIFRLSEHDPLHLRPKSAALPRRISFERDVVEAIERFAHREREGRTHFQDGKAIVYEGRQSGLRLVVGGMRLEHDRRFLAERLAEALGHDRLVVDDPMMVELDAGLHDEGDNARKAARDPAQSESPTMGFQRGEDRFWKCDLEVREPVRRASGDRHLAPDNVYWRLSP